MRCLRISVALLAFVATVAVARHDDPIDDISEFVSDALDRKVRVTSENVDELTKEVKRKYEGYKDFNVEMFDGLMARSASYLESPHHLRKRQENPNSGEGYLKCAACVCDPGFVDKFRAATSPLPEVAPATAPATAPAPAPATAPLTAPGPALAVAPSPDLVVAPAPAPAAPATLPASEPEKAPATADDIKTGDTKTGDTKAGDTKAGDTKTGDTKTGDTKTGDTKTGDTKTGDTNGDETASPAPVQRMLITFKPKAEPATAAATAAPAVPQPQEMKRLQKRLLFGLSALIGGLGISFAPSIGKVFGGLKTKLSKCGRSCSFTQSKALAAQGKEKYCAIPSFDLI